MCLAPARPPARCRARSARLQGRAPPPTRLPSAGAPAPGTRAPGLEAPAQTAGGPKPLAGLGRWPAREPPSADPCLPAASSPPDLYTLAKAKTCAHSIDVSKDGAKFATFGEDR